MSVKLESVAVDVAKENAGVWVDALTIPGVRFFVRSIENSAYQKAATFEAQRLMRKFGRNPPDDEMAKVRGELIVNHLLLGWDGLDMPFCKEAALERFTQVKFRRVCDAIESAARPVCG